MTIRERQILSGMDIKARTGDEIALKAAIANAQQDSGGGSSGSGITVIECEFVEDEENHSYTLTNADLIAAALTDIEQNPTHLWNYGLYVHTAYGALYGYGGVVGTNANNEPLYGFESLENTIVMERDTYESGEETITEYRFQNQYLFSQDDIDENGTATLTYSG